MILPDVNLLVDAVDESNPMHEKANAWWDGVLSSSSIVGLCYPSMLGFIRLATNRRVFANPLHVEEAVGILDAWLSQPNTTIVVPTNRHWPLLRDLFESSKVAGSLATDVHIAALALEHGYTGTRMMQTSLDSRRSTGLIL